MILVEYKRNASIEFSERSQASSTEYAASNGKMVIEKPTFT